LPAAGARARARGVFDGLELLGADLTATVGAHRLENVLDCQIAVAEMAGRDGAAVEREAGNIKPGKRHDHARIGLIAARKTDERVEMIAARDQLDGIGNDFAADERTLHPFRAHADAVGDRHRVELHGRRAGGANTLFDLGCQPAQMKIARPDLDPGVGDPDDGPGKVLVGKSRRFEHRPRRRPVRAIGDNRAARF